MSSCYSSAPVTNTNKTVQAVFSRDDCDDSQSSSGWGLVIGRRNSTSSAPRLKGRAAKNAIGYLTLRCMWDLCNDFFTDYIKFNNHLGQHLSQLTDTDENLDCCWIDCSYVAKNASDLCHHLCFHGYHTKLKSIGRNLEAITTEELPACTNSDKFDIPPLTDGYQCEWQRCNELFTLIYDYFEHVSNHLEQMRNNGEKMVCRWRRCTYKKPLRCKYLLAEHMRVHTKERVVACPSCGRMFTNNTKFCDHRTRQMPSNSQKYFCSQCTKYFPSERLLRDHMRSHINQYKCSMCEMTCPKPSTLAKHVLCRHLKLKVFKCPQCDYKCSLPQHLECHIRRHSKTKPFQCAQCNLPFDARLTLYAHYKTEHGRKVGLAGKSDMGLYECHNCKERFRLGRFLTAHLRKVHKYQWPAGHVRFRYKKHQDGKLRLQTVRYETFDVTEQIINSNNAEQTNNTSVITQDSREYMIVAVDNEDETAPLRFEVVEKSPVGDVSKPVIITISDTDKLGNVVKSEVVTSNEIVCNKPSLGPQLPDAPISCFFKVLSTAK